MTADGDPRPTDGTGPTDSDGAEIPDSAEIPASAVAEAERLTRLAREATGPVAAAYREARAEVAGDHGYEARLREADDTLVLYPADWLEGGTARPERIEETDRAVEVPLSGPGDPDRWRAVEEHNAEIVERVRERAGDVHAANVRAFADFMGNHYARRIESARPPEIAEFLDDYYPRNAWPPDGGPDVVGTSLRLAFEAAEAAHPGRPD
jgi:hypothetical protein